MITTTTLARPPLVTEHEDAHYWPNGAYDGPADDDCVWCSGLMQLLARFPGKAPASLFEAERLRQAAGLGPSGGSSSDDLIRGITSRYGAAYVPTKIPAGFTSLWAALVPGTSATISGIPTDAPVGSPFRRFLPNWAHGHRIFGERLDSGDRVWIMDPEGPADGTYKGQFATKADVAAFVAHGSAHTVAPIHRTVTAKVRCVGAKLRSAASKDAAAIADLALGTVVTVLGTVAGGAWSFSCGTTAKQGTSWVHVAALGKTGYVAEGRL